MANAPIELFIDAVAGDDTTGDGSQLNPWQTPHHAWSQAKLNVTTNGTKVWCKASGPYVFSETLLFDVQFNSGFFFVGYGTIPGDDGIAVFDGNNQNIAMFNKSVWHLWRYGLENIRVQNWGIATAVVSAGGGIWLINCEFNKGTICVSTQIHQSGLVLNCHFDNVNVAVAGTGRVIGCIADSTGADFTLTAGFTGSLVFANSVYMRGRAGTAFNQGANQGFYICNFVDGGGSGTGFDKTHSDENHIAILNHCVNMATGGKLGGWSTIEGNESRKALVTGGNVIDGGTAFVDNPIHILKNYSRPADFDFDTLDVSGELSSEALSMFGNIGPLRSGMRMYMGNNQPGGAARPANPFTQQVIG